MFSLRAHFTALLDLVAPSRCPGCDMSIEGGPGFCRACDLLLEPAEGPDAAYAYGGPLRDGIRRFKYDGRRDLAAALAERVAEHALGYAGEVDCVVCVPSHPRRRRERGFEPAAVLAAACARALGVPFARRRVKRVRDTAPQVGLARDARQRNLRGAFKAKRDDKAPRVLLIDDVRTTGATLREVAAALEAAGAREVLLLALAGRDEPEAR